MPLTVDRRRIGPDNDEYDKMERVWKVIGQRIDVLLDDTELPLRPLTETKFGARLKVCGGDSSSYGFLFAFETEQTLADADTSGLLSNIMAMSFDALVEELLLEPSALVTFSFNSDEFVIKHHGSWFVPTHDGDTRTDYQYHLNSYGSLVANAPNQ